MLTKLSKLRQFYTISKPVKQSQEMALNFSNHQAINKEYRSLLL